MPDQSMNYLQFVGYETQIRINLPIGWIQGENDESSEYPIDFYQLSNNYEHSPKIVIQIIPIPPDEYHANSFQELSEVLLQEYCQQSVSNHLAVLKQKQLLIHGRDARIDIVTYEDRELEVALTQYQACIQMDNAVCGVIATMLSKELVTYLPIFEEAILSIDCSVRPASHTALREL